jgi:hypothetical protein
MRIIILNVNRLNSRREGPVSFFTRKICFSSMAKCFKSSCVYKSPEQPEEMFNSLTQLLWFVVGFESLTFS